MTTPTLLDDDQVMQDFAELCGHAAHLVHLNAVRHGWHDQPREIGTELALIHSEVSEVLEIYRRGDEPDPKVPGCTKVETELADVIIRCLDFAHKRGLRIGQAIAAKHAYNLARPYRHGGKAF